MQVDSNLQKHKYIHYIYYIFTRKKSLLKTIFWTIGHTTFIKTPKCCSPYMQDINWITMSVSCQYQQIWKDICVCVNYVTVKPSFHIVLSDAKSKRWLVPELLWCQSLEPGSHSTGTAVASGPSDLWPVPEAS